VLREARTNVQDVVSAEQDELEQGLLQLIRLYETNPFPLEDLSLYYLNQWLLREGKQAPAWQADPLVTRLPAALEAVQAVRDLPRLRFTTSDFLYLQARLIQRDLARWVVARPVEEPLASWLAKADLNDTTRPQLAAAIQLCDWVVRNIQIEPLPSDEVRGSESWEALAQRGDDGPGYRRYPQETLMVGHGDAYERLHVFIQLCRQVELPAVVIGVAGNASGFRPWAAGVFVGEELYLFDLELGLPLPAADDQGVATLAGLAAHPQWLRQLDLDEKRPYRIAAADLESLEVRVVAMPEELSRRMILLQPALRSQYRMQVALPQDDWNARIAKHKQLSPVVKLWDVPILASLYCELGRNIRLSKDQEFAQLWDLEMSYLDRGQVLEQARRRHLQGDQFHVKRWGFHGASHRYISWRTAELLGRPDARIISCHLGGSNSLCAIRNGQSVLTTMGMSPQSGLPHNNRVGDFDPFAIPVLMQRTGKSLGELLDTLAEQSGLLGLSGISGDIRDLEEAAAQGKAQARLALDVFTSEIRRHLGGLLVELGGAEAIVFTGGIGENGVHIRAAVCAHLEQLGIVLDPAANARAKGECALHAAESRTQIWVIPTNEELVVARQTRHLLEG
jgi:hypothetical protein